MTQYLILPTKDDALDLSHEAYANDTAAKMGLSREETDAILANNVTKYQWAVDEGNDGQTAVVIDSNELLLSDIQQAMLSPTLDDQAGGNWEKPPPPDVSGEATGVDTQIK